jgi:hypothetical protein
MPISMLRPLLQEQEQQVWQFHLLFLLYLQRFLPQGLFLEE